MDQFLCNFYSTPVIQPLHEKASTPLHLKMENLNSNSQFKYATAPEPSPAFAHHHRSTTTPKSTASPKNAPQPPPPLSPSQFHSSQADLNSTTTITFSDLVMEGDSNSLEMIVIQEQQQPHISKLLPSFEYPHQITQYLQKTKGFEYNIVKENDSSLLVACKSSSDCPFHLRATMHEGLWKIPQEQTQIPEHNHHHHHYHSASTESSLESSISAPFRTTLSSNSFSNSNANNNNNPLVMYSSSSSVAAAKSSQLSESHSSTTTTTTTINSTTTTPKTSFNASSSSQASSSSSTLEALLKKRIKEIKETFKRIDDRLKVKCAEEVLSLLRARAKEHPSGSAMMKDEIIPMGKDSMNHQEEASSPPSSPPTSTSIEGCGNESGGGGFLGDFPAFSISERKRKAVGTYKCRICRKEGHNSRSCDALQQQQQQQHGAKTSELAAETSPVVVSISNQHQQPIASSMDEEILIPEILLSNSASAVNTLQEHRQTCTAIKLPQSVAGILHSTTSCEMPSAGSLINETLAIDEDLIRQALLIRPSQ